MPGGQRDSKHVYYDLLSEAGSLNASAGKPVWVVGTVQRRFWSIGEDRQSRLEVVAHHVELVGNGAAAATTDNATNTAVK
jgi:hypothetical protein